MPGMYNDMYSIQYTYNESSDLGSFRFVMVMEAESWRDFMAQSDNSGKLWIKKMSGFCV